MNILLIGGGGREHALAWAISKSPLLDTLYCTPANAGIARLALTVDLDVGDHAAIVSFCQTHDIALVVVGPEAPLVAGLVDDLTAANIAAFGPSKAAAQLEGSKGFTKDLCQDAGIPTARYGRFQTAAAARAALDDFPIPVVVKADGLAAGKGVIIAETRAAAEGAIAACFDGAFGAAGAEVVIEEFLVGEEASVFVLSDGSTVLPLATAQDHKRVGDGDTGPNTGGMGAYSPAPVMTPELIDRTLREIIEPTVAAMAKRGTPFQGVLYAGLMITERGPELIEYNARFGDPECQALMMRLRSDIVPALVACTNRTLSDVELSWTDEAALTVVVATNGYPGAVQNGSVIFGLDAVARQEGCEVFHAGTRRDGDQVLASGGRVLGITTLGKTVSEAQTRAYGALADLDWPEGFYRRDIGWRAIERERTLNGTS
ncbi:MAG: phosphoribosylamine--glycine ligase [Pseudomonadota bacterium]